MRQKSVKYMAQKRSKIKPSKLYSRLVNQNNLKCKFCLSFSKKYICAKFYTYEIVSLVYFSKMSKMKLLYSVSEKSRRFEMQINSKQNMIEHNQLLKIA